MHVTMDMISGSETVFVTEMLSNWFMML